MVCEPSSGGYMLSERQQQMVALFEAHVGAELTGDLATTMATMSETPHLNHVPTRAGGVGREHGDGLVHRRLRAAADGHVVAALQELRSQATADAARAARDDDEIGRAHV